MMAAFARILVALDRSAASEDVFIKALELARCCGAELVLLSTIVPDFGASYLNPPLYPGSETLAVTEATIKLYLERQEQDSKHNLEFLQSLAARAKLASVTAEINQQVGDPARSICEVADTLNVDLIIVGRRGYSGLNELLMSSVSNYVVHHAPCAVLVVQPMSAGTDR